MKTGYEVSCPNCFGGATAVSLASSGPMCNTGFIWNHQDWNQPEGSVFGCMRANASGPAFAEVGEVGVSRNSLISTNFSVVSASCPDGQPNTCDQDAGPDCVVGSHCVCANGFGLPEIGTTCVECTAGKFSHGGSICQDCKVGRNSPVDGADVRPNRRFFRHKRFLIF